MNLKNKYMKNIHVLPTEKPSRLFKIKEILVFDRVNKIYSEYYKNLHKYTNHNIYITSNEEIREGDCCLEFNSLDTKVISLCKAPQIIPGECILKKIILTTDQDLIKDGVQAIDDEFLEWFVKNPSCEFVMTIPDVIGLRDVFQPTGKDLYKIIIPKEESTKCYCGHTTYCDCGPKEEPKFVTVNIESATGEDLGKVSYIPLPNLEYVPKQETLEEAAQKRFPIDLNAGFIERNCNLNATANYGFIEGAKWQAERMYSEEDMHKLMDEYQDYLFKTDEAVKTFKEWFEQYKKK